jgi:hypothetical protein
MSFQDRILFRRLREGQGGIRCPAFLDSHQFFWSIARVASNPQCPRKDAWSFRSSIEEREMTDTTNPAAGGNQEAGQERVPVMQQILDNPFLLLFLGITIPTVFYIIWGVMEIVTIPIAK